MDYVKKMIEQEVENINKALNEAIPEEPEETYGMLKEYINRGGKRIRPLISILTAKNLGVYNDEVFDAAIAIELFHNFTLIHDDIEDNSEKRRGKPTLHVLYGIPRALNSGDALYTLVWERIIEKPKKVAKMLLEAFKEVVEGQGYELYYEHEEIFDLNEESYYKIAKGKTAALLAASLSFPALYKDESIAKRLYEAGIYMGLAFQLKDDLLNLYGDEEKYKKKIGDDISEGKRTLLVIHALKNLEEEKAERLKEILMMHTKDASLINEAISLITESGAKEYCEKKAEEYAKRSKEMLESTLEENRFKEALLYINKLLVEREQ